MELVIGAVLAFAVWRAEASFKRYLNARFGATKQKPEDPMPNVLWVQAMSESEEWAREDYMKRLHELYEQQGRDWNKVATMVLGANG